MLYGILQFGIKTSYHSPYDTVLMEIYQELKWLQFSLVAWHQALIQRR